MLSPVRLRNTNSQLPLKQGLAPVSRREAWEPNKSRRGPSERQFDRPSRCRSLRSERPARGAPNTGNRRNHQPCYRCRLKCARYPHGSRRTLARLHSAQCVGTPTGFRFRSSVRYSIGFLTELASVQPEGHQCRSVHAGELRHRRYL